jgi:hypothetical protein
MLLGILALCAAHRPGSWSRTAWPILALTLGALLFVPVEAQTRTYQPVGWWETFFSWIPTHPDSWLEDWLDTAGKVHVIQHKVGGFLAFAIGAIELGVARRWLAHDGWTRLLPWFSIAIGLSFAVHGGTEQHLPSASEQFQHWIMGAGFVCGGIVLALHQARILRSARWKYAWPIIVTATGVELSLFYRLAPGIAGHGGLLP